jgi:hypothetical protein
MNKHTSHAYDVSPTAPCSTLDASSITFPLISPVCCLLAVQCVLAFGTEGTQDVAGMPGRSCWGAMAAALCILAVLCPCRAALLGLLCCPAALCLAFLTAMCLDCLCETVRLDCLLCCPVPYVCFSCCTIAVAVLPCALCLRQAALLPYTLLLLLLPCYPLPCFSYCPAAGLCTVLPCAFVMCPVA